MKKDADEKKGNNVNARGNPKWISGVKPYEKLDFRDDFIFGRVMQDTVK